MPHAERVVFTLAARRERRQPVRLLDGMKLRAASGQDLVRIGLMAHIPHQAIVGGIENVVQRDGEFDGAQAGGEVSTARAHALNQELAQLGRQLNELRLGQQAQIRRRVDRIEQGVRVWFGHFAQFILSRPRLVTADVNVAKSLQSCG